MLERIDAAAGSRELFAKVERPPDGERAVLELVALDDLAINEAAAVLGLHAVTARVRLHRARQKLRRELCEDETAITRPLEAS